MHPTNNTGMEMNSAGPSDERDDTDEGTIIPDENKKDVAELHRKRKRRKGHRTKKQTPKSYSDVESEADSSKEVSKYNTLPNKRKTRKQGALSNFFKKSDEKRRSGSTSTGKTSEIDSDWDERNRNELVSDGKQYTSINPTLHPRDRLRRMTVKDALMEKRKKRVSGEHDSSILEKTILDNLNSPSLTGSMPDLSYRDGNLTPTNISPSSTLVSEHKKRSRSTESKIKRGKRVTRRPDLKHYKNDPLNKTISDTESQATETDSGRRHSISPHAIIHNNQPQSLSAEIPSGSQIPSDHYITKSSTITTEDGNNKNQQQAAATSLDAPSDPETLSSSRRSLFRLSQIPNESRQSFEDSERERRESFGKFMDLRKKLPTFSQSSLARVRNEELGEYSGLSSTEDDGCDIRRSNYSDSDPHGNDILEQIDRLADPSVHPSVYEPIIADNTVEQSEKNTLVCNENITSLNPNLNIQSAKCLDPCQHVYNEEIVSSGEHQCALKREESIKFDSSTLYEAQNISPTKTIPGEIFSPSKEQNKYLDIENQTEVNETADDITIHTLDEQGIYINLNNDVQNVKNGDNIKLTDSIDTASNDKNYMRSVSDTGAWREPYKSPRRFVRNRSASNVPLEGYSCRIVPEKKYRSLSPLSPDQAMQTLNATNSSLNPTKDNEKGEKKRSQLKYRRSFSPKQRKHRSRSLASPQIYTNDAVEVTKVSVAVQTSLENVIYLYPSDDKNGRGNSDADDNNSDILKKQYRGSLKKKHKSKENKKRKERKRRSKSKSLDSVNKQSGESVNKSQNSINEEKSKRTLWDKIQSDQTNKLSPSVKPNTKYISQQDLSGCKSSSALDISIPSLLPEIHIEGARSRVGRLSLDESSLLKKSKSAAEIHTPATIDDILSCQPFGPLSASAEKLRRSESHPAIADANDRKASTSSQQEPQQVVKVDSGVKKETETETASKPQGKISILAIVALKRKLARRRKIKAEAEAHHKEETKDQESQQDAGNDKYNTFVSIENETNLNLSELAFLKETAILDDDYYDGADFHHPAKKKISFDPIVSDEPLEDEHIFGRHGSRYRQRRDSTIREKQKKVLNCCKKFLAFLFSHIGLCTLVVAYSIMGGIIFKELEQPFEKEIKINVSDERKTISHDIGRLALSVTLNKRGMDEFVKEVERLLSKFQRTVWNATEENGWNGKDYTSEAELQWSFASSLLFAITIMTTIGYGHVAPKTAYGRIVTIAYAILGIPLTLLCLTNIGDLMATGFRFLYGRICCGWCCILIRRKRRLPDPERGLDHKAEVVIHQNDKHAEVIHVPTSICILLMTSYIFLGTVLFSVWEEWDMLKGTYFSFITLSTIGLGDVVPGTTMWESEMKLVFCAMYLIFGLSLIAMCFNLVQEDVKAKCRWLGTKLGIIDTATSDV